MKESVNHILDFLKKHKYGSIGLTLLLIGLIASGAAFLRLNPKEKPLALSELANAISAGQVVRIEDIQGQGELTVYYEDGTQATALKDNATSFLEQMKYLGVSEDQLARLKYEVVSPGAPAGEQVFSAIMSLMILGLAVYVLMRFTGGGVMTAQKKFVEGQVPDVSFKDVAGIDECREELADRSCYQTDFSLLALYVLIGADGYIMHIVGRVFYVIGTGNH